MTAATTGAGLELSFLGTFDVRAGGKPVPGLDYNKLRGLLAYLAVEPERDHDRDALAGMFWPGNDPPQARANLRRTLFDLRNSLEIPAGTLFATSKNSIRLIHGFTSDVSQFVGRPAPGTATRTAESMVALYRGDFLAGLAVPDSPDFEAWAQAHRESLRCRALALLEQLWRRHSEAGEPASALPYVLRHAELEPWDEDVHRQAMALLVRNGQAAAAVQQFEICTRLLREELGTAPGEATKALYQRIKAGLVTQADNSPAGASAQPETGPPAERRPVTVLYCEVAPTAAGDDPDESMAQLDEPTKLCAQIIAQNHGHVSRTPDGGLLGYFGYPQGDEHAARHAVEAALAITRESFGGVDISAGVHSGIVIAGTGPDSPDVVGRTSKLAARLRHGSSTNKVLISRQTRDLVAGYFDCESVGVHHVAGFSQPLEVFGVERQTGKRTRVDALTALTPMAGRMKELAQLESLWEESVRGKGVRLLILGEAGIGKSRLLQAFKEKLSVTRAAVRELRCFPEYGQSPFHPLIDMLESLIDVSHGESAAERFMKLAGYFENRSPRTAAHDVPLLANLLSLPVTGRYRPSKVSLQKQKELTIQILADVLATPPGTHPLLLVFEDLHWIDPSSLDVLNALVGRQGHPKVFVLLTARPEFAPPWEGLATPSIELMPLGGAQAADMVRSIGARLPEATVQKIVERSDGVPLFVEEMTRMAGSDDKADIPPTLHDLLAARIDRLGGAKRTAQVAATLGREFDVGLLRRIFPASPTLLEEGLAKLQEAGLVLAAGAGTLQFKHALIQEAAYSSLPRGERQAAHRRVAEVLEKEFPEIVDTRPELLAQHRSAAGEARLAIEYWGKAGQRASQRSALEESIEHFKSGLKLLETLPPNAERDTMEFTFLVQLCPLLYAVVGYGSQEATRANARLAELSELVGNTPALFEAKWAIVMNTIANAGSRGVPALAAPLLGMAGDDPLRQQAAHYAIADAAFWLGDFETTREHTARAMSIYAPEQHAQLLARFGEDLSVSCGAYHSWSLYFLGDPEKAQATCATMLARARELNHPHTLALALCFTSVLHRWLDKPDETLTLSTEQIAVSTQYGLSVWLAAGQMTHGWARARIGDSEGILELETSVAGMKKAIGGISVVFISALAEALVHLGMHSKALVAVEEAFAEADRTGDGHFLARLHRLKAQCGA